MIRKNTRRRFLDKTALAGGLFAHSTRKARAKMKRILTVELIKVGVVGVGEYSHMPSVKLLKLSARVAK